MPEANDAVIVVCPTCASSNRVPRGKLAANGKCGKCYNPLFAGAPVTLP